MNLLKTDRWTDYTIIIGCGRLGADLANTLSNIDGNVLIMDIEKEAFRKLSSSFGGLAVVGDGMDFDALKEARVDKAQVVVVVTNNDNANIMIAQIAREVFKVKRVIARLYDHERASIYQKFDIDIVCPAALSTKEIDKILSEAREQEKEKEAESRLEAKVI